MRARTHMHTRYTYRHILIYMYAHYTEHVYTTDAL